MLYFLLSDMRRKDEFVFLQINAGFPGENKIKMKVKKIKRVTYIPDGGMQIKNGVC